MLKAGPVIMHHNLNYTMQHVSKSECCSSAAVSECLKLRYSICKLMCDQRMFALIGKAHKPLYQQLKQRWFASSRHIESDTMQ